MDNLDCKPKLYSYTLVDELPVFFDEINRIADNYDFIAVAEKRCYNLLYSYLPAFDKLCTFQGLMTQSMALANYYRQHHSFPRILFVDDLIIHGRRMRKYIDNLEKSLLYCLKLYDQYSEVGEARFRKDFLNAVSMRVYAKTIGTILMEDRYLAKLSCYKKASYSELRDLSIQLSDSLTRRNTPNADYSPSIWFRPSFLKKAPKGWMKVQWEYEKEEMILYYRINDRDNPKWLSTVRVFPMRKENEQVPAISYSMLNGLQQKAVDELCSKISEILTDSGSVKKNEFSQLQNLLKSSNPYLNAAKRELINYLLSLDDLCSFVLSMRVVSDFVSFQKFEKLSLDYKKIALNFGSNHVMEVGKKPIVEEFKDFLSDQKLFADVIGVVRSFFEQIGETIQDISWISTNTVHPDAKEILIVNQQVLSYFSEWGMRMEDEAHQYANQPYLFKPALFQEYYSPDNQSSNKIVSNKGGDDGGALFTTENKSTLRELQMASTSSPAADDANYPLSSYLAAYLYMMDIGIMGNRGYLTIDQYSMTLIRSGELATCYFPKLIAAFIPAFSYIESRFSFLNTNKRLAITDFWDSIKNITEDELGEAAIPQDLDEEKKAELRSDLHNIVLLWPDKHRLNQGIKRLYESGQSFNGWDFPNICYPNYNINLSLQMFFKEKASIFMNSWFMP